MSQGLLSNEEFFARLAELFETRRRKDHGTVVLTQKRFTHDPSASTSPPTDSSNPLSDLSLTKPLPILIRATNAKSSLRRDRKVKLSTVVEADAIGGFYTRYAEVCKAGMSGLKKRDRSKAKERLKAKKKKKGGGMKEEDVKK